MVKLAPMSRADRRNRRRSRSEMASVNIEAGDDALRLTNLPNLIQQNRGKAAVLSTVLFCLACSVANVGVFDGRRVSIRFHMRVSPKSGTSTSLLRNSWRNANDGEPSRRRLEARTEPSHIALCRGVLDATIPGSVSHQDESRGDGTSRTNALLIVEETSKACLSTSSTQESILSIFASSLISRVANRYGLGVEYRHSCSRFSSNRDNTLDTLQMILPSQLISVGSEDAIGMKEIKDVCKRCVGAYDMTTLLQPGSHGGNMDTVFGTDCLFQHHGEELDEISDRGSQLLLHAILPAVRANLRVTVGLPRESGVAEIDPTALGENQGRRRLTARSVQPWWGGFFRGAQTYVHRHLLANTKTDAPSHDEEEVATIYLDGTHGQMQGIPFHLYGVHIPTTATNIHIYQSADCANGIDGCYGYGLELERYLTRLHPRARVILHPAGNIHHALRDMLISQTLICPSASCLLPALARDGEVEDTIVSSTSFTTFLPSAHTSQVTKLSSTATSTLRSTNADKADAPLSAESFSFVYAPPTDQSICSSLRGRMGHWEQNLAVAPQLQYRTPLNHYFGFADRRFQPTDNVPYRQPTTYSWVDDATTSTCPINIQTMDSFCDTTFLLGVKRVFVLGDLVSNSMALSLYKILGQEDTPQGTDDDKQNWETEITCPSGESVVIAFARNDKMEDDSSACPATTSCHPWKDRYTNFTGRTLLVANYGTHFYSEDDFSSATDRFVSSVKSLGRPEDIVYYRTTLPGHDQCQQNTANSPFKSFVDYEKTITWKYSWDLFDGFNDIAARRFREHNAIAKHRDDTPTINVLDVYPMTILRQDGHISGRDCKNCDVAIDCLHYSLPGPADWWSHLLFSNLADQHQLQESSVLVREGQHYTTTSRQR